MQDKRLFTETLQEEDLQFELSLRPSSFTEFVGQNRLKKKLDLVISAAKQRKEAVDHLLFFGPPGLGKTTLAHIIAKEMGVNIKVTSGPVIDKAGDLAGLLTNLNEGDVLFIDEIHRLNHIVEEYLYPAMEDFSLDIIIDQGPNARSVRLNLPHFTLIGATTRAGLLTSPLRSRFGMTNRLDFYPPEDLSEIVKRSADLLRVTIKSKGSLEIAKRSRGTPRIANNLLKRVRDYAQIKADNIITQEVADKALKLLDIDSQGLDEMDNRILGVVIDKFAGGPVGLNSIAVAVGEESGTIEELYEPFLIQQGYLKRTPAGRMATENCYRHLQKQVPNNIQKDLWDQ